MKKLSHYEFIEKAILVHGDLYDYSKSIYRNTRIKIIIVCKFHGEFKQTPASHLYGRGCFKCGVIEKSKSLKSNTNEFIEKAKLKHGDKYNYSKSIYLNAKDELIIICKEHGEFKQIPNSHLSGRGCILCCNNSPDINKFIKKAKSKHGDRYDYSKVEYINSSTKIIIICKTHGEFKQTPSSHLINNCSKCTSSISKMEMQWLDSLNVPEEYRQKTIIVNNKKYKVDAFNPTTNTVYEFYGDYWHGNPLKYKPEDINQNNKKTFKELYKNTLIKEQDLFNSGYNITSVWECDFCTFLNDSKELTKGA